MIPHLCIHDAGKGSREVGGRLFSLSLVNEGNAFWPERDFYAAFLDKKTYNGAPLEVPTCKLWAHPSAPTLRGGTRLTAHNSGRTHGEGLGCIFRWQYLH